MTHDEIRDLLAGYAIDALTAEETSAVAEHLASCPDCSSELASLQVAVDALAGAVPQLPAPERLRARLLLDAPEAPTIAYGAPTTPHARRSRRASLPARLTAIVGNVGTRQLMRRAMSVAAVLLVVALSATTLSALSAVRHSQDELLRDRAALGLLTSTETTNDLLTRQADSLPADAHGHWFHRPEVMTQVVVGERLPQPGASQRYVVWMQQAGSWIAAGELPVDATGYGRLVVLGSDGSAVRTVVITLETGPASQPGPTVLLASSP